MTIVFSSIAILMTTISWWFLYNRLVRLNVHVQEAWSGIDVQLRRRADVIPKLEKCLERYMSHERATLMEITSTRAKEDIGASKSTAISVAETGRKTISGIDILIEDYPDLKSDSLFLKLMSQIRDIENDLQHARRYYNGTVKNLNNAIQKFPSNIVASAHGFGNEPFFEVKEIKITKINLDDNDE